MFEYEKISSLDGLFSGLLEKQARGVQEQHGPQWAPHEHHGPRFQGRSLPVNDQLDAVARYNARIAELNRPKTGTGIIERAVAAVVDAVALTGRAKAMAWLTDALANGPQPARDLKRRAATAGITATALRRGRKKLKVRTYMRDRTSFWALP
jgi:hypothetical protein